MTFLERVYEIFSQLNAIPRASHHEEKVADFLCQYAERLGLDYDRDAENCVVIRKPASPGCEEREPVVLLNHMDMVAVGDGSRPFDPLTDGIEAYVDGDWMKARGTSLGADNGIGLSMALAVLADDSLVHPALEVLTTTNEEDGMSGAANLSTDFIKGRRVINLDSEDYDTITVGAAGAYLQVATLPVARFDVPEIDSFFRLEISGGLGGHSGVDINKGRINANRELCHVIRAMRETNCPSIYIAEINGGDANASIPGRCCAVVGVRDDEADAFVAIARLHDMRIRKMYPDDPDVMLTCEKTERKPLIISCDIARMVDRLPCGTIMMRSDMPDTVMTSNNIGVIRTTEDGYVTVSCHTRSFSDDEMVGFAEIIQREFEGNGADVKVVMNTPGWQENTESSYLKLVDDTFRDVLNFSPRKVAMHFVLEAGYYVQKYPGIEIACIGPRIIEPHSAKERVQLSTVGDICMVLVELLKRLSCF